MPSTLQMDVGPRPSGGRKVILLAVLVGVGVPAGAQEALSVSLAGEQAARSRRFLRAVQPHTFRAGEAEIRLGAGCAAEWNDNITLVERGRVGDSILRPQVNADLSWPLTEANHFEASVSLGYAKYADHAEFDRPFVLPGSAVAFDLFLRDVRLTFEDRLSYQQDAAERAVVAGTAEFGGLANLAGVRALADWGQLNLSISYHHHLFLSSVTAFRYLDRSSHQMFARLTVQPRLELETGIEGGLTPTAYHDSFLRDNLSHSGGTFAEWIVSPHVSLRARAGAVFYRYETGAAGGAGRDAGGFYFSLGVAHRLRRALAVTLDLGRDSQLGVNNDLVEQFSVRPTVNWMISRQISAIGTVVYEDGRESGLARAETFQRLGFGLTGTWQWARRWNLRVGWHHTERESNQPLRGYRNHRVLLEVGYQR